MLSRRQFVQAALAAGVAAMEATPRFRKRLALAETEPRSTLEKLNLAFIGVAGRGATNLNLMAAAGDVNIVALCDIDSERLREVSEKYPAAKKYQDCRELIGEAADLDGVVISTPDHLHAIPAALALRKKIAIYCEKPLTHSVHEARVLRRLSREAGVPTQMGNQTRSAPNFRRVVELVRSGAIGDVQHVQVWVAGEVPAGRRVDRGEPPKSVNYDLWLGPAPDRAYHESHFHFYWRYWWDFGGGQLADYGCHSLDSPIAALELSAPTTITARGEKGHAGDNECPSRMQVDYEFPAAGNRPGLRLTWRHGGWLPEGAEAYRKNSAVLWEGTAGRLLADYHTHRVFLNSGDEQELIRLPAIDAGAHHREWLQAIRDGSPTSSPFEEAGRLTETVLLGNVAYRAGQAVTWDAVNAKAVDCPGADAFLKRDYREGWVLEGEEVKG